MKEVVIAGYLRTAQTRSRPNDPARDWFCKMRADELLAKLMPEVIKKSGVEPEEIDDFLVGCATGVSEQWAYGGRNPLNLSTSNAVPPWPVSRSDLWKLPRNLPISFSSAEWST
jgi:acetyl-CoA C-acetyltransferase